MTVRTENAPVSAAFNENVQFIFRSLFSLLLVYTLVWFGYKSARILVAAYHLNENQQTARLLLDGGVQEIDPDQLEYLLMNSRQQLLILDDELAFIMPLTRQLGWVPEVGPLLQDAPALMDMALASMDTLAYAFRGMKPAVILLHDPSLSKTDLLAEGLAIIETAQADLAAAGDSFDQVIASRERLGHTAGYPAQLQEMLNLVDPLLPFIADSFDLMPQLPGILGLDGPKSYLLLAQNEDELRGTGGFISGAGVLEVENGRILTLEFGDAYNVDDLAGKPYSEYPPAALYDFMQLDYFLFRDANYWPDFPTSAEKAMGLYEYGQNIKPLDGTIAIDQQFLVFLLQGLGGIVLPSGETITADNLVPQLRASWSEGAGVERDWIQNRKAFLGEFSTALRQRLESGDLAGIDPLRLISGMQAALTGKHLQIYMRDTGAAAVLDRLGWDGRLTPILDGDYLFVLDTNAGFNKSNALVEKQINYFVQLHAAGDGIADLTIDYSHNGQAVDTSCTQIPSYGKISAYEDITNLCYYNFLRVYTPQNAYLLAANEHMIPAEILLRDQEWRSTAFSVSEFDELSTFANFFYIPQSQSLRSYMGYQLPQVVQGERSEKTYSLTIPKQAGVEKQALTVTLTLPPGAEFQHASIVPTAVAGNLLRFELTQVTDLELSVVYRLPMAP